MFVLLLPVLAAGQQVGNFRPDSCPRLVCGDLNADHNVMTPDLPWVCAQGQDPTKIIIDACPDGLFCEPPSLFFHAWDPRQYFTFKLTCNETMKENPYEQFPDADTAKSLMSAACNEDVNCGDRLAVGVHPKQCLTDSDCLQMNGATTTCTCGSDGNRYCALSAGDRVLADWQRAACSGTFERFLYWDLFKQHYPYLHGAPHCLGQVFSNIGLMHKLAMGQLFATAREEMEEALDAGVVLVLSALYWTLA